MTRRDILIAFGLFLVGTAVAQTAPQYGQVYPFPVLIALNINEFISVEERAGPVPPSAPAVGLVLVATSGTLNVCLVVQQLLLVRRDLVLLLQPLLEEVLLLSRATHSFALWCVVVC